MQKRQKEAAEDRASALEKEVARLQAALRAKSDEVDTLRAEAEFKDAKYTEYFAQVRFWGGMCCVRVSKVCALEGTVESVDLIAGRLPEPRCKDLCGFWR